MRNRDPVTLIGNFKFNNQINLFELYPHETGIKEAG